LGRKPCKSWDESPTNKNKNRVKPKGVIMNNNKDKVNTVFKTSNYQMFKKLKGNRRLNLNHAKKLMAKIKIQSLCVPIIVNERYEVVDGQHRLYCWEKLNKFVYYIIIPGYSLTEVQTLNTNSKTWKISDYADSYCELRYKDYCKYKEFKKKYNLGDYESIAMLQGSEKGSGKNFESFRNGQFKIKNWNKACGEAKEVIKYKEVYEGYKRRAFVFALLQLINNDKVDKNQLLRKARANKGGLEHCTNKEQYLIMLEKLYNYRQSNKISFLYS
tara:strand:+ start:678 stop:1493 length:816 start_codon:yes stop_codon:yes gene_type:complete